MTVQKFPIGTIAVIGTVVGGVLIFFVVIFVVYKRKNRSNFTRTLSLHEVKEVHSNRAIQINDNCLNLGITNPKYESIASLVSTLGITLFSKENLVFDQNLGEGAFGKVKNIFNINKYLFYILCYILL